MTAPETHSARDSIQAKALELGFDVVRFTNADLPDLVGARLCEFLEAGRHGDMTWMASRREERANPRALWPEAESAIILGMNYGPDADPLDALKDKDAGVLSVYAQNKDYHDVVKKKLKQLGRWMTASFGGALKVFVDTAPVMEKPLAMQGGAGWQGKHTNLVSREFGSWLFLGVILTTLRLPTDDAEDDHCGSCRRCVDICPTDAFPAPYQLDAQRCISYLTIEHKGPVPAQFRQAIGNRIYGCDDCLAVCPWNKFAARAREAAFHPRDDLKAPRLAELARLDDASFRKFFSGSPVKRVGRDRFIRNVAIAIGNSANRSLAASVVQLLDDDSPLVRGAAVWAAAQLFSKEEFETLQMQKAPTETESAVKSEWADALG